MLGHARGMLLLLLLLTELDPCLEFKIQKPHTLYAMCLSPSVPLSNDLAQSFFLHLSLTNPSSLFPIYSLHFRCFRLQKDCSPSVPNRKRTQKKVPGSRTAHLEEKLDDLVSLIRSQTAVKGPNESPTIPTPGSLAQSGSDATALPSLSSDSSPNTVNNNCHPPSRACPANKTNPTGIADSAFDCYVPETEAEQRLDLFRHDYPRFGPVVYIPPTVTAKELHQTRPLLWISIMACTTRSTKEAHVIGEKIRHIVSDKVVRQYERSLDLLQCLLVFLCW